MRAGIIPTIDFSSEPFVRADNSWYTRGEKPPIGTGCEFRYKYSDKGHFADWKQGTIKYIGSDLFVAEVNGREMVYNGLSAYVFRPIQTERDKEIGALIDLICFGGELSKDGSAAREIAKRIYEATNTKRPQNE